MKDQRKELSKYIIPALISNLSFFVLNIVDGIFVGNGVGIDALGAISLSLPWLLVVNAVAVLFTIGGVTVASVRLGRGDVDGANQAFMHSFAAIIISMLLLTVIGTVWSDQVARMMGANDTFQELVSTYIFWYSVFLLPAGLFTCLSGFCRNDGNPRLSTVSAIVCTAANIFGDWLLVFPLDKGIGGAAFASGAAQLCSVIILWFHYTKGMGQIRFQKFKPERTLCQKVFLRGTPEMVNQFASPITMFSMNHVLIGIGDAHVNAYSVILYAGSLFSALMYGLSTGLQPLYGRSYGAKDDKALRYYIKTGLQISLAGSVMILGLTFVIGEPICFIFGADAAATDVVTKVFPKYCLGYFFAASTVVIGAYLFSTKRTQYAVALNVCRSLVFNFVCINFLPLLFGAEIVWYTLGIAEAICLCIAVWLWKRSERNGIVYR